MRAPFHIDIFNMNKTMYVIMSFPNFICYFNNFICVSLTLTAHFYFLHTAFLEGKHRYPRYRIPNLSVGPSWTKKRDSTVHNIWNGGSIFLCRKGGTNHGRFSCGWFYLGRFFFYIIAFSKCNISYWICIQI